MLTEFETRIFRALLSAKASLHRQCFKRKGSRGAAAAYRAFHDMMANPDCAQVDLKETEAARQWIRFAVKSVYAEHKAKIQKAPLGEAEDKIATLCKQFFVKQMTSYLDIDVFDADHPVHGNSVSLSQELGGDGGSELGDLLGDKSARERGEGMPLL